MEDFSANPMNDLSGNPMAKKLPVVDHYGKMLFKIGQTVLYNGQQFTITGWSTNEDSDADTFTYKYQLNNTGDLVQETNLSAV